MKKSKIASLVLAGALTTTALLAGTYAWQSISQEATNEIIDELNSGGRLHDDFDGKNKDVYVENFTSTTDGATIYARIRLDEYLEIGAKAGQVNENDGSKKAKSIVDGATFESNNTWTTYLWNEDESVFRDYMKLLTGGSTTYMPTFNKNKDSLEADVNGTLGGGDKDNTTPEDAYDDYVDYTENPTITGTEVYDADADTTDEGMPTADQITNATADADGIYGIDIDSDTTGDIDVTILKDIKHTAKTTLPAELISMDTWLTDKGGQPGPYWVYDDDGWVYWAQGITPDTATGCLLTGVEVQPGASFSDEYYYAINVVAQFATAGHWGDGEFTTIAADGTITKGSGDGFYERESGITARGLYLLEKISEATKTVTITVDDSTPIPAEGLTGVAGNNTATFSAVVKQGESVLTEGVTWSVEGNKDTKTNITQAGILTIGEDETASSVTVVATSKGEPVTLDEYIVLVDNWYTVAVTQTEGNTEYAAQGSTRTFKATVQERGATDATIGVTWEVVDMDGNPVDEAKTGTKISSKGVLTIGENETATSLKVIARCTKDTTAIGEYTVENIIDTYAYINQYMTPLTKDTITIDGIAWYVMAKEGDKALLWASDNVKSIGQMAFDRDSSPDNVWETSSIRVYLNNDFLSELSELSTRAEETTIYTRSEWNTTADVTDAFKATQDKVFLFSEADLFGKINTGLTGKEMEAEASDYTYDGKPILPLETDSDLARALRKSSTGWYWLRSPRYDEGSVAFSYSNGASNNAGYNNTDGYVRPALWINLSAETDSTQ